MGVNRAVKPSKSQGEPLEIYELVEIPMPKASPGSVVVRVTLRPVNPTDSLVVQWGTWSHLDLKDVVVGSEGVGLVHELGEGVTKVKVGERVIPLIWNRYYPAGYGLWRDYVEVPEKDLVPVPSDISDETACQFIINPFTAYGLLKDLDLPKGEYFLQTAAGSVLGRQIIALAKHYGIKSINTVRRDDAKQELKDLGADYVINTKTEDLVAQVNEITGGNGVYGGVDAIAGESSKLVSKCVRPGGKVLVFGGMSADYAMIDIKDMLRGVNQSMFLVNDFGHDIPRREETVRYILDLMSKKIIQPLNGKTYPLEDFKEAIKETFREARGGKVFLSSY